MLETTEHHGFGILEFRAKKDTDAFRGGLGLGSGLGLGLGSGLGLRLRLGLGSGLAPRRIRTHSKVRHVSQLWLVPHMPHDKAACVSTLACTSHASREGFMCLNLGLYLTCLTRRLHVPKPGLCEAWCCGATSRNW